MCASDQSCKPYLVTGTIEVTPYNNDTYNMHEQALVWALDADQALAKFVAHWENKTKEYCTSYYVNHAKVADTIL